MLQRDAFIEALDEAAEKDKNIVLLSADLGAEKLDAFRAHHPKQFFHCGISEQHTIDFAAGLSLAGKTVFVYCMGPFLSLRCYEQIKCSLAMMNRPVTLISAGVGLGYADSGPTHYATEDIACLRALNGIEVLTPADNFAAVEMAKSSLTPKRLRYIRLDREPMPDVYAEHRLFRTGVWDGFHEIRQGGRVCILSSGYMLHRAIEANEELAEHRIDTGIIDLFQIKPISADLLLPVLINYDAIVTVEEQCLSGGFGSAVVETLVDCGVGTPVKRMGLPDRYYFENGGRANILDSFGLSVADICETVKSM